MDEVLGVRMMEVQETNSKEEQGDNLSPKSSLLALQKESAEKQSFSKWLNVLISGVKYANSSMGNHSIKGNSHW